MSNDRETVSEYIALSWYDGPLLEIARVDFAEPRSDGIPDALIQVCSLCTVRPEEAPPSAPLRGAVSGEYPWTRAIIRLGREDLQAMMDLLDGKPVKDYNLR